MEATLSFNACHIRRTLQVQHTVGRLTSHGHIHKLRQGTQYTHQKPHATVCYTSTGDAYRTSCSQDNIPQQQSRQLPEVGPDLACFLRSCRNSGMKS
ncbi:hypothetical protein WJX77_012278 [Trebouxia sp. C0004]